MKRFLTLLAPTLILLFCGGPSARADKIPYLYNFSPVLDPDHPTAGTGPISISSEDGTGSILLTDEPKGSATGNSDIVATNINVSSLSDPNTPEHIGIATPANGDYTLKLVLTDKVSSKSATIFFKAALSGDFSSQSANINNTFLGSTKWTGVLGANTYTVSTPSYANPGPPSASNKGSISFHVAVSPTDGTVHGGGGGGSTTPEPSSMLLSCLGLSFLGAASWRKRRARVA